MLHLMYQSLFEIRSNSVIIGTNTQGGPRMKNRNIEQNEIEQIGLTELYNLLNVYTPQYIKKYQDLNALYSEVLNGIANLFYTLDLQEPVSIFVAFVALLRQGYFSHQHKLYYRSDLNDIPFLLGVDVLCSKGVCRTFSAMLSDLYNQMGIKSNTISVHTSGETLRHLKKLCPYSLQHDHDHDQKFVTIISSITQYVKISNHALTLVEWNGKYYIFDPTNDGFLYQDDKRIIRNAYAPEFTLKRSTELRDFLSMLYYSPSPKIHVTPQDTPAIPYEEYSHIYHQILQRLQDMQPLLDDFYEQNCLLYKQACNICKQQKSQVKRKSIFPTKKKR